MATQVQGKQGETAPAIRPFQSTDMEAARSLLNSVFATELFTREWLTWKYGPGNPHRDAITLVIETADQEIIGFIGLWPRNMALNEETVVAFQLLDAAIHPAFQRQGLYGRLVAQGTEYAQQAGAREMWGMPNAKSFGAARKIGCNPLRRLRWFVHPLSALGPLKKRQPIPFEAMDLCEPTCAGARPRFARDADYLRWRYQSCPLHHYDFWELGSFQHGKAYAVTMDMDKKGLSQTTVVDLVGANLTQAEQGAVLRSLIRHVSQRGRVLSFLEGTIGCDDRSLMAHGFFPVPKKGRWIIRHPLPDAEGAIPLETMQVCPGDTDTF